MVKKTVKEYVVLRDFLDAQDDFFLYEEGGQYPRSGYTPSEPRIKELSGKSNAVGEPLIK